MLVIRVVRGSSISERSIFGDEYRGQDLGRYCYRLRLWGHCWERVTSGWWRGLDMEREEVGGFREPLHCELCSPVIVMSRTVYVVKKVADDFPELFVSDHQRYFSTSRTRLARGSNPRLRTVSTVKILWASRYVVYEKPSIRWPPNSSSHNNQQTLISVGDFTRWLWNSGHEEVV